LPHSKILKALSLNAKSFDFSFQIKSVAFIILRAPSFKFLEFRYQIFISQFAKSFQPNLLLLISSYSHVREQRLFLTDALKLKKQQCHLKRIKALIGINSNYLITKTSWADYDLGLFTSVHFLKLNLVKKEDFLCLKQRGEFFRFEL